MFGRLLISPLKMRKYFHTLINITCLPFPPLSVHTGLLSVRPRVGYYRRDRTESKLALGIQHIRGNEMSGHVSAETSIPFSHRYTQTILT